MSKHTPGPWTMQTVPTSVGVCFKVGPFPYKEGKLVHACIYADYPSPGSPTYEQAVANATLIATAPELLAAAELARHILTCYEINRINGAEIADEALQVINAAIAKATGTAP